MNPDLIYIRTSEGERLARSPRQISVYSHRATLLLVDGHIDVGELKRRFGTTLPIEEALAALERDGLVRPKVETEEAVAQPPVEPEAPPESQAAPESEIRPWPALEEAPLYAPEQEAAAEEATTEQEAVPAEPEPAVEAEPAPTAEPVVEPEPAVEPPPAVEPEPIVEPVMPAEPATKPEPPRDALPDPEPVLADFAIPTPMDDRPVQREKRRAREGAGKTLSSREERAPTALPAWLGPKAIGIGVVGLGLALVAGLLMWLAGLRPQIEERASAALGVPVSVGSLGVAIEHGPALALHDVIIHQEPPLALGRVELRPDPHQGNVWSASRVLVTEARLRPSELGALTRTLGGSEAVSELAFESLGLRLGTMEVGDLAGRLEHEAAGGGVLKLTGPRGVVMEARPSGSGLSVLLGARPEVLPMLGQPRIATVELRGFLNDAGLRAAELGMTGYGGKFEGSLEMTWNGPVMLNTRLRMAGVAMDQVSRAFFGHGFAEGLASGNLTLGARAASWEELARIDTLTGSFVVERGALEGFDLGSVVRERSITPAPGGETRFETLRGRLEAGPKDVRVWVDHLDAGALTASGWLTIAGFETVRGELSAVVQVPGRGAQRYPAQLSGTVAQPSIQLKPGVVAVPAPAGGARAEMEEE